jgi:hypothetical protein
MFICECCIYSKSILCYNFYNLTDFSFVHVIVATSYHYYVSHYPVNVYFGLKLIIANFNTIFRCTCYVCPGYISRLSMNIYLTIFHKNSFISKIKLFICFLAIKGHSGTSSYWTIRSTYLKQTSVHHHYLMGL